MQLEIVRLAMKERLIAGLGVAIDTGRDEEFGQVAKAQIAAENGDRSKALDHLRKAGAWTITVAKEVGAEIVDLTLTDLLES